MSDHVTNGRTVAQIRRWLEIRDHPDHGYKGVETLSCLITDDGEHDLTVTQLRTLLAEHDTYREEARTARTEPAIPGDLPETFLTFIENCITGDERTIKDPDLRPAVLTHAAYNSGWDIYTIWDECQAKRKILANYRTAQSHIQAAQALADLDAQYPTTPPERDERPSDAHLQGRLTGAYHALMAIARLYQDRPGYRQAREGKEPTP